MSDIEFDVLDELYFVTPFEKLLEELTVKDEELKTCLLGLLEKKWVKCFKSMDEEAPEHKLDFDNKYKTYAYLATKEGLLAHNRL
ncbi:transporter [Flammeovirgaceae bacterium SG7u.111]|nr:transporter [Flammeovirgaceae bacterium SG7u.132]WPO34160.1 transporter [Flammeovirgaceae bacterium SG7u.111]